jgi:large subunit ribosomal protein L22
MRKVADMIRGEKVEMALHILEHSPQEAAGRLHKLLLSALANWQNKNEGVRLEDSNLVVKTVMVDGARSLKRIQPAPQGRAYRIRKRSNHVHIALASAEDITDNELPNNNS